MEEDPSLAAVQCSVIQYCSESSQNQSMDEGDSSLAKADLDNSISKQNSDSTGLNDVDSGHGSIVTKLSLCSQETENDGLESTDGLGCSQSDEGIASQDVKQQSNCYAMVSEDAVKCQDESKKDDTIAEVDAIVKSEEDSQSQSMGVNVQEIKSEEEQNVKEEDGLRDSGAKVDKRKSSAIQEPAKKKRKNSLVNGTPTPPPDEDDIDFDSDEEIAKPRRRGRTKKNPDPVPAHLSQDMGLGYRILTKFLETPLFTVFSRLPPTNDTDDPPTQQICLTQIKKKFDENAYNRIADFVNDVRTMLSNVYMQRDAVTVKKALRLEQVLDQRIAQLPNYLRPECSLILTEDESNKKTRINKGGGFVSLLQERAEKLRQEKDREKRKVAAEERKQMKEEQDKDVLDWEKNILLKDHEDDIKSTWELLQIGHFIHLCANILNIGDVSQFEVERMLIFPQCSDTLDLIMTALLSNSLMRAKLDRTPSMPYTIWQPQVRSRVNYWYRAYHREYRNPQKTFEELGVEPEFWQACGPDHSPLDYFNLHEIPFIQRVWIVKTLCDVDFVRKKTVYDNMRQQPLEELEGRRLGMDRHGNRYLHFPQFNMSNIRIYRQSSMLDADISPSDLHEFKQGFDERSGEITLDKVFRDIWDVGVPEIPPAKKPNNKNKKKKGIRIKVKIEPTPPKSLRIAARAKRKPIVESSDSDSSDTNLATLKNKLNKPTFISLNVFRLPREKVKPVNVKKSYYSRKLEREEAERQRLEELEANKDKVSVDGDQSESMEPTGMVDDRDDEDDDTKDNFIVKNLGNLKMVLKKDQEDGDNATDGTESEEKKYRYTTPAHMLPDRSKFYCVVDSVAALRQLIAQLSLDDNDLDIINKSSLRSSKIKQTETKFSCEEQLLERLQQLLADMEDWDNDFLKGNRTIREKMYKEYTSYINRPADFVHPNEGFWQQLDEAPAPPPAAPAEPEPLPPEVKPVNDISLPPSPLGSLRPRTRTRTSQPLKLVEPELDDADEEALESSCESDDNWEMPMSKHRSRRKIAVTEIKTPTVSSRPKRSTKKNSRYSNSAGETSDKSLRATFCSSSDPSEALNWEEKKLRILEKHSPGKVVSGDIQSEMNEIEMALENQTSKTMLPLPRTRRILPPPIPGNKKLYFNQDQLKVLTQAARKSDDDVQIVGNNTTTPTKARRVPSRTARPIIKKTATAGTQSCELIDLESPKPVAIEQYFVTDGTNFVKIEEATVQELIKNQEAVRRFSNELDLNQKIQIVKKRSVNPIANNLFSNNVMAKPASRPMVPPQAVPESPRPGLRLIRPHNLPNQIIRPTQRVVAPQNVMYVQSSQPQIPQGVSPGLVQVLARPPTPGDADKVVQVVARGGQGGSELVQVVTRSPAQADEAVRSQQEALGIMSSTSQAPVGYYQVQASGKQQPLQFVQVSQSTSNAGSGTPGQNMMRVAVTTSANVVQPGTSFVRFTSTGQLVQLQQSPQGAVAFKPQIIGVSSPQSSGQTQTVVQTAGGAVNLVQVQGLPGEQIAYVPLSTGIKGNLVQIQQHVKGSQQIGTIVQMGSPGAPRLVQMQTPARIQGGQQTNAPQAQLVQFQRPVTVQTPQRPATLAVAGAGATTPRPQTALVQVYASPRMQATAAPVTSPAKPHTLQQVRQPISQASPTLRPTLVSMAQPRAVTVAAPAQTSPRPAVRMVTAQQVVQGGLTPLQSGVVRPMQSVTQQRPAQQLVRMQAAVRPASPGVRQPSILAQTLAGNRSSQLLTQVEIPGKPGFYQLQNADGQTVSVVQLVTSTPSNVAGGNIVQLPASSGTNMIQMQAAPARQQLIQVQGSPATRPQFIQRPQLPASRPQLLSTSAGNVMLSGATNRPQLVSGGMVVSAVSRPQMVQVQAGTSAAHYMVSGQRPQRSMVVQTSVSSQPLQRLQPPLVQSSRSSPNILSTSTTNATPGLRPQLLHVQVSHPSPTKAPQVFTIDDVQPILVRTSSIGGTMTSKSPVMVSSSHPVISIDEDDDDITISSSQCGTTVIDGVTYQIATSSDQVLFNSHLSSGNHRVSN